MKLEKMEFCEYNKALLAGELSRDGCKLTAAVCPPYYGEAGREIVFARLHEIAHRCNVHDELVAALEDAEFLLRRVGNRPAESRIMADSFKRSAADARAAIAKAKGE